jgi:acetyltransferase
MQAPSPHPINGETLTTRTGCRLLVRAAAATDEPMLKGLFEHLTPDDLRFRFLSGIEHVRHEQLAAMLRVDHIHSETFLAFDGESGQLVATAMLAADPQLALGEVAISVHRDFKGRGIGWTLLEHVARAARAMGIGKLQSIESRDNHAAIELEREMGFTARTCPGDPTLVIVETVLNKDEDAPAV